MRALGIFFATWLIAFPTWADEPATTDSRAEARRAYKAGVAASESGDLAEAARSFARADELAPNATALESALEAVLRTDDAALGMQLVERAEGRSEAAGLAAVPRARAAFAGRAGRVNVRCTEPCSVTVDGTPAPSRVFWLAVGGHRFRAEAASGGSARPGSEKVVEVRVGVANEVDLTVDPSAVAPAPAPGPAPTVAPLDPKTEASEQSVLSSPAIFFVGVGATAILGGIAAWSFTDVGSIHSDFEAGSAGYDGSPSARRQLDALASDGQGAAARSWILLGAAGATAVGTGLVGVFVTDWGDSSTPTIEASVGPLGGSIRTRF